MSYRGSLLVASKNHLGIAELFTAAVRPTWHYAHFKIHDGQVTSDFSQNQDNVSKGRHLKHLSGKSWEFLEHIFSHFLGNFAMGKCQIWCINSGSCKLFQASFYPVFVIYRANFMPPWSSSATLCPCYCLLTVYVLWKLRDSFICICLY